MTLRRRSKGVENLRLANVRDYIITEDEGEHSPFTLIPPTQQGRLVPRRVNQDTEDDIAASFKTFSWQRPRVDGLVLCEYRRFLEAMSLPTKEAIVPWVEFVGVHIRWERVWILENPVAAKREMVRKFEGTPESRYPDIVRPQSALALLKEESTALGEVESKESLENVRRGAVSRIGFRDEMPPSKPKPRSIRLRFSGTKPRIPVFSGKNKESGEGDGTKIQRPMSSLGFRDVKVLKTLKKKALTNPWQRKSNK